MRGRRPVRCSVFPEMTAFVTKSTLFLEALNTLLMYIRDLFKLSVTSIYNSGHFNIILIFSCASAYTSPASVANVGRPTGREVSSIPTRRSQGQCTSWSQDWRHGREDSTCSLDGEACSGDGSTRGGS